MWRPVVREEALVPPEGTTGALWSATAEELLEAADWCVERGKEVSSPNGGRGAWTFFGGVAADSPKRESMAAAKSEVPPTAARRDFAKGSTESTEGMLDPMAFSETGAECLPTPGMMSTWFG